MFTLGRKAKINRSCALLSIFLCSRNCNFLCTWWSKTTELILKQCEHSVVVYQWAAKVCRWISMLVGCVSWKEDNRVGYSFLCNESVCFSVHFPITSVLHVLILESQDLILLSSCRWLRFKHVSGVVCFTWVCIPDVYSKMSVELKTSWNHTYSS